MDSARTESATQAGSHVGIVVSDKGCVSKIEKAGFLHRNSKTMGQLQISSKIGNEDRQ